MSEDMMKQASEMMVTAAPTHARACLHAHLHARLRMPPPRPGPRTHARARARGSDDKQGEPPPLRAQANPEMMESVSKMMASMRFVKNTMLIGDTVPCAICCFGVLVAALTRCTRCRARRATASLRSRPRKP